MRTSVRFFVCVLWLASAPWVRAQSGGETEPSAEPATEPSAEPEPLPAPDAKPAAVPALESKPAAETPLGAQPPARPRAPAHTQAFPARPSPSSPAPRFEDAERPPVPAEGAKPGAPAKQAEAEKKPAEEDFGKHRVLGEHAFPLAAFVSTPFAASYVSVRGGIEYHLVPKFAKPIALFTSGGQERVDLQTLNVTEAVDFEVRLFDLLALYGSGYGRVRAGVNAPTLLGNGLDYRYGGDGGALLKVFRIGPFQLALRGQLGYYAGQQAGILGLFQDLSNIVNGALANVQMMPTLDLNTTLALIDSAFRSATLELLTPLTGFRYGASVNGALGITRYLGLQASFGILGDRTVLKPRLYDPTVGLSIAHDQVSTTVQGRGALAFDVNAAPAGFPFDFMLEYALTFIQASDSSMGTTSTNSSAEQLLALGVYYSGRPDLQLGGTFYTLLGQVPIESADGTRSGKPQDLGAQLVFHYIW